MSFVTLQPLLAADLFETIVGVLFFILWIAAQLLGGRKEAQQKKQPRPEPQQPPPIDLAKGAPPPRNQADALRGEVEDFLRRAQGKPLAPQQQKPPRPPQPAPKKLVSAAPPKKNTFRSEGVAEHVARHISTQDIAAHTKTLGAEVATADDQLEARLREKFDHNLGRLKPTDTSQDDKPPSVDMAAEVAAMLRSPEGMKKLILANEILRRPEW